MSYPESTSERRRLVFDLYARMHEDVPEDCDVLPATDALVRDIARETRLHGKPVPTELIRTWLNNPGKFSPYIDEVAVKRAIEFDFYVVDNLTVDEMALVIRKLAERSDPWGVLVQRDLAPHTRDGEAIVEVDEPRREAFMAGTASQRGRLQMAVSRLPQAA